jgi:hypothetical protein
VEFEPDVVRLGAVARFGTSAGTDLDRVIGGEVPCNGAGRVWAVSDMNALRRLGVRLGLLPPKPPRTNEVER